MPLTVPITEEMVRQLAPDDATWARAEAIADSDALADAGVSSDGTWLLAEAKGSGKSSYSVSADFADSAHPVLRSSSPSRQSPDKYALALLLKYARKPDAFGVREPGDDLLARREKKVAADERKKFGPSAPKREKKSASDKQTIAQREGLEALDRLLVDLVAEGHWFDEAHLEKIERVAKSLHDARLPLATTTLRRLLLLGKQKGIGDEERQLVGVDLIGQLWAVVQHGRKYVEGKVPEGESPEVADAIVEEMLGKPWHLSELKDKGYGREELSLLELAFERIDDDARQQRIEISDLVDLSSGDIVQAIAYRPYKGVTPQPEQTSYSSPVSVTEAVVYPGFLNRRVAWEKSAEKIEKPSPEAIETAYNLAVGDFAAIVEAYRDQLKHPLAPRDGVFLLQPAVIGNIGDRHLVLEDESGARIEVADRRKDYSNVANLRRAVAMLGNDKPAVLVRLFIHPTSNAVLALPLAALTAKQHLRLGL